MMVWIVDLAGLLFVPRAVALGAPVATRALVVATLGVSSGLPGRLRLWIVDLVGLLVVDLAGLLFVPRAIALGAPVATRTLVVATLGVSSGLLGGRRRILLFDRRGPLLDHRPSAVLRDAGLDQAGVQSRPHRLEFICAAHALGAGEETHLHLGDHVPINQLVAFRVEVAVLCVVLRLAVLRLCPVLRHAHLVAAL